MTPPAFTAMHAALTELIRANPGLLDFAGWPEAEPVWRVPQSVPAMSAAEACLATAAGEGAAFCVALGAVLSQAEWRQTYTEEEVGRHFLDTYGYIELVGPEGHFVSRQIRAYVGYWGPGLYYPWHHHQAEELYYILAGEALFEAEGLPPAMLRPGDIRVHGPNQPHAMTTFDSPVLALALWRGAGMDGLPLMGRA